MADWFAVVRGNPIDVGIQWQGPITLEVEDRLVDPPKRQGIAEPVGGREAGVGRWGVVHRTCIDPIMYCHKLCSRTNGYQGSVAA